MKKLNFLYSIILLILIQLNVFANEIRIETIEFHGNERTPESILNSIIKIKKGDIFHQEDLETSIQYLKNTTVFSTVTSEIIVDPQKKDIVHIKFNLDEKWTIIPYAIAGSGGNSSYYTLGFIDTNFLGRLYNFGLSLTMLNNKPNGNLFFKNEHTFNLPLITQIGGYYVDVKKILYSNNSDHEIGYFSYKAIGVNPSFLWKFYDYLMLGSGLTFIQTEKINDELFDSEIATNKQNNIQSPSAFTSTAFQITAVLGKMNYDGITQQGATLTSVTNTTARMYTGSSSGEDYTNISNSLLAFYRLPYDKDSNLAFRLVQSQTSSNNFIQQIYFGGLNEIRGFLDNQFSGKFGIFSNLEYRLTAYRGERVAFQVVPFFDSGVIGTSANEAFQKQMASSYGIGIRLPLTKINGIVFRLDYAQTISPFSTQGTALNLTQFF